MELIKKLDSGSITKQELSYYVHKFLNSSHQDTRYTDIKPEYKLIVRPEKRSPGTYWIDMNTINIPVRNGCLEGNDRFPMFGSPSMTRNKMNGPVDYHAEKTSQFNGYVNGAFFLDLDSTHYHNGRIYIVVKGISRVMDLDKESPDEHSVFERTGYAIMCFEFFDSKEIVEGGYKEFPLMVAFAAKTLPSNVIDSDYDKIINSCYSELDELISDKYKRAYLFDPFWLESDRDITHPTPFYLGSSSFGFFMQYDYYLCRKALFLALNELT